MAQKRIYNDRHQFFDDDGNPLSGGQLFFYLAGSSTKNGSFSDMGGSSSNANPMVLDAAGRLQTEVWIPTSIAYKLVLAPATDSDPPTSPIWTEDYITGVNDTSVTTDQWILGATGTYISSTSFSVPGDQTSFFTVGRSLKIIDAGGTKYGWIKTSVFGAVTTITLDQNSSALASPVSTVYYGIIDALHPGSPILADTFPIRGGSSDESKQVRFELDGITTATTRTLTPLNASYEVGVAQLQRQGISGLTWANDVSDATNDIAIQIGAAIDRIGGSIPILFPTAMVKRSDATWTAGSGGGALDTGAVGNNDYYIHLIGSTSTGASDILFSLTNSAPTMPGGYDIRRVIGWFKRVGGSIVLFNTYEMAGGGIELLWSSPTLDIDLAATLTTTRRTDSVKTPQEYSTNAILNVSINDAGANSTNYIYCPDQADLAPSGTAAPLFNVASYNASISNNGMMMRVRTDITGKIAARSTLATVDQYRVVTLGFEWNRLA